MSVGKRIKARREQLGLTQDDLAKRLGYTSKSAVCKAEKDDSDMTTTRIQKYADALSCTPGYLMGWEEEKHDIVLTAENDVELIIEFHKLNDDNKKRLSDYMKLLIDSQK